MQVKLSAHMVDSEQACSNAAKMKLKNTLGAFWTITDNYLLDFPPLFAINETDSRSITIIGTPTGTNLYFCIPLTFAVACLHKGV